ncbi:hypothetical protein AB8A28_09210 [Tardiphaga sp. 71_E8_N1_1]|uniref:hypothetical protein n=1 Tax=Tardiphaga sp. 71_E8_N1_1 TaxID=3240784 RepID=UPI003F89084E
MGVFGKLSDAIKGEPAAAKAQGYLRPIDTAAIARKLNLNAVARERGTRNLPASDVFVLDAVEQQITQSIESEWSWHGAELINNLRAYAARLVEFSVQTELANIRLMARNTLTQFRDVNHRAEAELGPLRETYVAFRDELKEFQQKNGLRRTAREPSGRLATYGLLFVVIAVEAILNGIFFSKGSDFGLVGGVLTAVAVSAANVSLSFSIGLFPMRWLNHRSNLLKLTGLSFSGVGVAALIALHGFAAHYREALGVIEDSRAREVAYRSLVETPFGLADLDSYYLFAVGAVCSFLAIWKGYRNDDPYPHFGAYYRRARDAREDYSDEHAKLFEDLEDIKEKTVTAINAGTTRIPLFPQQAAQIRSQRNAALDLFRAYETSSEASANQLLAIYRDANRDARTTPVPAHFLTPWKLPGSFLRNSTVVTITAEAPDQPQDANAALRELSDLSQTLLNEYDALIARYPHPTHMAN